MPDDQVHASLAGGVGRVRSHAGFGNAIFAYGYAGFVGHLGEGAVAVVVVENWGFAVVIGRVAIATHSRTLAAAIIVAFRRPIHVVGHYQVEKAVVVVIEPGGARRPLAGVGDSGMSRHIGKGAVPVVVVQNRSSVSENQQIGETIVVVVSDRYPHPEQTLGADTRLPGHVCERAVSVIPVERAS